VQRKRKVALRNAIFGAIEIKPSLIMKSEGYDSFINDDIFPKGSNIFGVSSLTVKDTADDCVFVLDTNALLVPYGTESETLTIIANVYKQLKAEKRLILPGQVAREFAKNRPEKLKEIFSQLKRKQTSIQKLAIGNYPLLADITEFKKLQELELAFNEKVEEYSRNLSNLLKQIKSWNWNDPVSLIYREIFTDELIYELNEKREELFSEFKKRLLHKIPPGYKDGGKDDDGIGDFLIWKVILDIAKSKKNVIFISGDEKSDWYHVSEKQILYPRFELVAEFNRISTGKSFNIIKLSQFLEIFDVKSKVIEEVQNKEGRLTMDWEVFDRYEGNAHNAVIDFLLSYYSASVFHQDSLSHVVFLLNKRTKAGAFIDVYFGDDIVDQMDVTFTNYYILEDAIKDGIYNRGSIVVVVTGDIRSKYRQFEQQFREQVFDPNPEIEIFLGVIGEDGSFHAQYKILNSGLSS
jgi:hypothetical protein